MKNTIILLGFIMIFYACEIPKHEKKVTAQPIDYSSKSVLDSLIETTPVSKDTLFLGFLIGMNKIEYEGQIKKLRDKGEKITYSESNRFSIAGNLFELGAGYTFQTNITLDISGKTLLGEGKYFLEPR